MLATFIYFLLPFFIIVYGIYRYDNIPDINSDFGFKSKYAIVNEESYNYANEKINEYCVRFNSVIYILVVALAIFYIQYSVYFEIHSKILFFTFVTIIEIAGLVLPIVLVNKELKDRYFEEYNKKVRQKK